ncbi:hypothetical protein O6H91_10G023300 [Diphasiastrum complanatum]|uniref:Uncharacterized protein n=2 Tax=Diphasiastrum complanatum TaxID=34168 RepID=A0ACC2CF84_DIPCM|nr:hypothetical protein O6H91_10G023300 [Diphasiastrum complanatum]KAJ7540620.1 hypothetical protein O6H91_10G023300 [Diphasiastrum complanatum]
MAITAGRAELLGLRRAAAMAAAATTTRRGELLGVCFNPNDHRPRHRSLFVLFRPSPAPHQSLLLLCTRPNISSSTSRTCTALLPPPPPPPRARPPMVMTRKEALWIKSRFNPPWVHATLPFQEQEPLAFSTLQGSDRLIRMEQLWQEFFSDPSQWWDNRLTKIGPKYPDFKHKITREGLWVDGWLNPSWVKEKVASMARKELQDCIADMKRGRAPKTRRPRKKMGHTQSGDGLRSRVPYSFCNGDKVNKLCQEGRLKEAIHMVEQMVQQTTKAPIGAYVCLLKGCSRRKALAEGKQVHALIVQSVLDSNILLANTLVHMYSKCGSVLDAHKVFSNMPQHNVYSWTAIISAYADSGQAEEAIKLFQQMQETGLAPDKVVFVVVLKACARLAALEQGKQLHSDIIRRGFQSDVIVGSTLVDMYSKCGCTEDARELFNNMSERDVVSWTAMIAGYAQNGLSKEAFALYEQMKQEGVQPNNVTLSTLVDMYAKCGCTEDARELFNNMSERDVVSWSAMIAGYAQNGLGKDSLALYEQMKQEGVQPDNVTFVLLLQACASLAALEQGKQLHSDIIKRGFQSDVIVGSTLVDMYSKCGCTEDARELFNNMSERNVVSWTAMIAGYAQNGLGKEALALFDQMQREGTKPNEVTYICVLSACAQSRLVDEGRHVFDSMYKNHGVTPTMEHYACMVDLLGRAGCLADAELFIDKMPIQPGSVVWMSLLGAARNHGNVEIGRRAFDRVMKLEPKNAAPYVLLSNIYAAAGRKDELAKIRNEMKDAGVKKMPGCSWIEVDNQVHAFVVGEATHPQSKEILAELDRLVGLMKEAGYIPDLSFVLDDVEDKEKENALCRHSVKLAVAFGLIKTPPGTPIRIKKNLWVCGDCHNATKIISKIVGREIIVMDANRSHHFKDGFCFCGDYW